MRVLIAEDDPVSRRLLQGLLTKWGYDVVTVCDGEQAWEILQHEDPPRLAILDWMMPGMDGLQVCRHVRKRRDEEYMYLILLTAKSQKQDLVEGMDAGADDYVTKPFDANELKVRLRAGRRVLDLQTELLSMREALREQATHDPLTGLPNRLLFSDRLTQQLAQAHRQEQSLAVMFLDLDRFKLVNDTLGHSIGDLLLKEVASRLLTTLRKADTVARTGGDEFLIIVSEILAREQVDQVARKVLDALSQPFVLDGHKVDISASIGVSTFPEHGGDVETLVKKADTAMYLAKDHGRDNYQYYQDPLAAVELEPVSLEKALRAALARDELILYYQPRVDIATGKTVGAEALVRWRSPDMGLVPPGKFIPLAEETGLIVPISEWVLRTACTQNKQWQEAGLPPVDVTVNVSSHVFARAGFCEAVGSALRQTHLDPQYLGLEVTESTLTQNIELTEALLRDLSHTGVRVSIDDLGTGQSWASYLKRFPVDAVKIDRSFISAVASDADTAASVAAMIGLAHSLHMTVIAEGVETLEQLNFLRSLDCDEVQGYFVSPPVPAEEFAQILRLADGNDAGNMRYAA